MRETNLNWAFLHGAKIDDTTKIDEKWRLVWEIVTQGAPGQDLSGIDLSETTLRVADLSDKVVLRLLGHGPAAENTLENLGRDFLSRRAELTNALQAMAGETGEGRPTESPALAGEGRREGGIDASDEAVVPRPILANSRRRVERNGTWFLQYR